MDAIRFVLPNSPVSIKNTSKENCLSVSSERRKALGKLFTVTGDGLFYSLVMPLTL
jgi:hypothetical protein